jgi:hypothetical protein
MGSPPPPPLFEPTDQMEDEGGDAEWAVNNNQKKLWNVDEVTYTHTHTHTHTPSFCIVNLRAVSIHLFRVLCFFFCF